MSSHVQEVLREVLGLAPTEVTPARLLAIAEKSLGATRATLATDAIRRGPLCERHRLFGELAALSVGTTMLGERWWSEPLPADLGGDSPTGPSPDQFLAGHPVPGGWSAFGPLDFLGPMIAESAAPPTNLFADLNMPMYRDVVPVPPGAKPGDRFPVSYDYGARLDAVVKATDDGDLFTMLDLDTAGYSAPANVAWAVDLALGPGRHLLPGEQAGTETDPYLAPMPAPAADLDLIEAALAAGGRPRPVRTTGDGVDVLAVLDATELFDVSRAIWGILADRPSPRDYSLQALRKGTEIR